MFHSSGGDRGTGIVGSVKYFRPQYPKILSRIVLGCAAFFIVFPIVTEGVMFLVKRNSNGNDSIDLSDGEDIHETVNIEFERNLL
jgi:hypothetical protein